MIDIKTASMRELLDWVGKEFHSMDHSRSFRCLLTRMIETEGARDVALKAFDIMEKKNAEMKEALKLVEWAGSEESDWCPVCYNHSWSGHSSDCKVANALKEI